MDEALEFILKAAELGRGSEIFIPKIRAYNILDVINALKKIIGDYGEENIGIRPGEKLHETLINSEEIRYSWEYENLYLISNPLYSSFHPNKINEIYPNIKKITDFDSYSSDIVEKIPSSELEQIFKKTNHL